MRTTKALSMRARVSELQVVVRTWIQLRIENSDDFLSVVDAERVGESGFLPCQCKQAKNIKDLEE